MLVGGRHAGDTFLEPSHSRRSGYFSPEWLATLRFISRRETSLPTALRSMQDAQASEERFERARDGERD